MRPTIYDYIADDTWKLPGSSGLVQLLLPLTQRTQMYHPTTTTTGVYFGGCAWGSLYFLGTLDALATLKPPPTCFGGTSAGALYALGLGLNKSTDDCRVAVDELSYYGCVHGCIGMASIYHDILLRRWLPDGGTEFAELNGRLFIGVTTFPATPCLRETWTSNEDLRETCHESMHIPLYCGYESATWTLDGGLSKSFWDLPGVDHTIYISPIEPHAHVTPRIPVSIAHLIWPMSSPDACARLEEQGRQDMLAYLDNCVTTARPTPWSLSFLRLCLVGPAWSLFFGRRLLRCLLRCLLWCLMKSLPWASDDM